MYVPNMEDIRASREHLVIEFRMEIKMRKLYFLKRGQKKALTSAVPKVNLEIKVV